MYSMKSENKLIKTLFFIMLPLMFCVVLLSTQDVSGSEKYTLQITDKGERVLGKFEEILAYPYDIEKGEKKDNPEVRIGSPSDPVELSLRKGSYQLVIVVLGYPLPLDGRQAREFEISLKPVNMDQDKLINLLKYQADGDVPKFISVENAPSWYRPTGTKK